MPTLYSTIVHRSRCVGTFTHGPPIEYMCSPDTLSVYVHNHISCRLQVDESVVRTHREQSFRRMISVCIQSSTYDLYVHMHIRTCRKCGFLLRLRTHTLGAVCLYSPHLARSCISYIRHKCSGWGLLRLRRWDCRVVLAPDLSRSGTCVRAWILDFGYETVERRPPLLRFLNICMDGVCTRAES